MKRYIYIYNSALVALVPHFLPSMVNSRMEICGPIAFKSTWANIYTKWCSEGAFFLIIFCFLSVSFLHFFFFLAACKSFPLKMSILAVLHSLVCSHMYVQSTFMHYLMMCALVFQWIPCTSSVTVMCTMRKSCGQLHMTFVNISVLVI